MRFAMEGARCVDELGDWGAGRMAPRGGQERAEETGVGRMMEMRAREREREKAEFRRRSCMVSGRLG